MILNEVGRKAGSAPSLTLLSYRLCRDPGPGRVIAPFPFAAGIPDLVAQRRGLTYVFKCPRGPVALASPSKTPSNPSEETTGTLSNEPRDTT